MVGLWFTKTSAIICTIYMHRNFVLHFVYWYMCDVFHVMNILVCVKFMYNYPRSSTITHHERRRGKQRPGCSNSLRQAVQFRLCEQRGRSFFLYVDSALVWCILSQLLCVFIASLKLWSTGYKKFGYKLFVYVCKSYCCASAMRKWSFFELFFL